MKLPILSVVEKNKGSVITDLRGDQVCLYDTSLEEGEWHDLKGFEYFRHCPAACYMVLDGRAKPHKHKSNYCH